MEIINERKASDKTYNDLLDMLLKSTYEDNGEAMTNEQIADEVLILLFAGHETTANTLSSLFYLLSSHKDVLQKLTKSFGDSTVYDCINNEYLKATISETMRLYPAAWMTERVAMADDEFEQFSFPEKTIIIPFFYGLHRDKTFWNNGQDFEPERFILNPKVEEI